MDVRERAKLAEDERILSMTDGNHSEGRNPEALEADKARYKDSTYEIVSKVAYLIGVPKRLNGWIKEELYIDFRLEECRTRDAVKEVLHRYVDFYNRQRPCFAIGYDTPYNYCKRFYRGELEHRDTFSQRVLSEKPKFVQKREERKK